VSWLTEMAAAEYFKGIDGMLNDELIKGFQALGLGRLLH
jgi:hypothetical protein